MKSIYKSLLAAVVLTPALTGCVEEVFPTNGVTQEQLETSDKATEALVYGMAAYMNHFPTLSSSYAYDWGYGSLMHIRDVMTSDMAISSSSYDWYTAWEQCRNIDANKAVVQFVWNLYTQLVLTANNTIAAIDPETASDAQLDFLGMGYAYRASHYLDMARMYEFLPNDIFPDGINEDGNNVMYLTVPILTEKTTEEEARNNPRATRQEMFEFILEDLTNAEKYINGTGWSNKTQPTLAVVYGLFARLYMWVEDYPMARQYASKAIGAFNGSITTQDEWLSTSNGFNTLDMSSWMWGVRTMKEDDVVQTGILNWTSWSSNETYYGYASAGPYVMIGASTYNRISNTDFRKYSYKTPAMSLIANKVEYIDPAYAQRYFPTYASLKFRPGEGNMEDYNIGSATAYPLMRLEEMLLIAAEAAAHENPAYGLELLKNFMTQRDPNYNYTGPTTEDAVVEEIVFQKRVELWGEGQSFFDIKRLNYPVNRYYTGTNFPAAAQINTTTRPAWMNICIVITEANNNAGVRGYNNPNPSNAYTPQQ